MPTLETRFSGGVPENYDRGLGPFIFEHYARQIAERCGALNPRHVLETAAGTGIVSKFVRESIPHYCSLVATDLNQPMLDYAAAKLGADAAINFAAADACQLPFEDGQFDVIVCQFGVMFYPDRQASYEEAFRVLKPGGSYLFSVWDTWAENPFAEIAYEVGAEFCADDPPAFYKVPFCYNDVDTMTRALNLAGFSEYSAERLPHTQTLFDANLFAKGIVYGNPLREELLERNIEPEAVCGRIAQALRDRLGETMPLQAIFVAATKKWGSRPTPSRPISGM